MNRLNSLQKATGFLGAVAISSLVGLPAIAQVNPSPSIFNEPAYDGNANTGRTQVAPSTTSPSIQSANPADAAVAVDREFAIMAAQSNNAEIQTSQLALQRSESEEVQEYAQRMIQEHTLANQQLQQLASQLGIQLPSDAGPLNTAVAQRLAQLSGEEFDRAYMMVQADAHLRAVGLYRTEIGQGQDQALVGYANQLLPSIEEHYTMASEMVPQYASEDLLQPVQ